MGVLLNKRWKRLRWSPVSKKIGEGEKHNWVSNPREKKNYKGEPVNTSQKGEYKKYIFKKTIWVTS